MIFKIGDVVVQNSTGDVGTIKNITKSLNGITLYWATWVDEKGNVLDYGEVYAFSGLEDISMKCKEVEPSENLLNSVLHFAAVRRELFRRAWVACKFPINEFSRSGARWSDIEKSKLIESINGMATIRPFDVCNLANQHGRTPGAISTKAIELLGIEFFERVKLK